MNPLALRVFLGVNLTIRDTPLVSAITLELEEREAAFKESGRKLVIVAAVRVVALVAVELVRVTTKLLMGDVEGGLMKPETLTLKDKV